MLPLLRANIPGDNVLFKACKCPVSSTFISFGNRSAEILIWYIRSLGTFHLNLFLGYRPILGVLTSQVPVILRFRARLIGHISLSSSASYFSQKTSFFVEQIGEIIRYSFNVFFIPFYIFHNLHNTYTMSMIFREIVSIILNCRYWIRIKTQKGILIWYFYVSN